MTFLAIFNPPIPCFVFIDGGFEGDPDVITGY